MLYGNGGVISWIKQNLFRRDLQSQAACTAKMGAKYTHADIDAGGTEAVHRLGITSAAAWPEAMWVAIMHMDQCSPVLVPVCRLLHR